MGSADSKDTCRLLWAKSDPYHPLWCHMLDGAAVCKALLPRFGAIDGISADFLLYVVALHDIGKADPRFQCMDDELAAPLERLGLLFPSCKDKFRHEARSFEYLSDLLRERFGWKRSAVDVPSLAVCGHHGNFASTCDRDHEPEVRNQWKGLRDSLSSLIAETIGIETTDLTPIQGVNMSTTGVKLTSLIVLSDWIASNEKIFRYPRFNHITEPADYWAEACKEGKLAVSLLGFEAVPERKTGGSLKFADVWPSCSTLRPSQSALEDVVTQGIPPGLAIIEAPMGEGKTEAAIYLAENWSGSRGTYIALPTTGTSNQMHQRYSEFLSGYHSESGRPHLVHGMAWLMDDIALDSQSQTYGEDTVEESIQSREWFRNAKRALLAPYAVGTIDQALMAALNVKFGFLRLLGLSSKVLIIDEVHACDDYMNVLLTKLLRWCGAMKIPVILLSATLSGRQKAALANAYRPGVEPSSTEQQHYPLLTFVPLEGSPILKAVDVPDGTERKTYLKLHRGLLQDKTQTAALALDLVKYGGCACVLVNTVKDAQQVYLQLKEQCEDDTQVLLFHSRFIARRRMEIESEVISLFGKNAGSKRPKKAILVATQVVEQSLDIDFDVMVSQIAPVDLLLQRTGRMHRHDRDNRPTGPDAVLHILLPDEGRFDFGSSEHVYDKELLLRTFALLQGKSEFVLPDDFRPLIETCYSDEALHDNIVPSEVMSKAKDKRNRKNEESKDKAKTHLIPDPDTRSFVYAELRDAAEESEGGERASYFHAQTRIGDESRAAIVIPESRADLLAAVESDRMPTREILKELFLYKATLPGWWINGAEACEGYSPLDTGRPKWLRGHLVMVMNDGEWRGQRQQQEVVIIDDPLLGFYIPYKEKPASD